MNLETYLAKTKLTGREEAQQHLTRLKMLFWSVFLSMVFVRVGALASEGWYLLMLVAYIGLLVYFVTYCVRVINLTKEVTTASALWSVIFAPLSWIWFYPAITKPLRVIVGEEPVPDTLPSAEDRQKIREGGRNRFYRTLKIIGVCAAVVFAIALTNAVLEDRRQEPSATVVDRVGYQYVSAENGFEMNFPNNPTRNEETTVLEGDLGSVKTVTYQSVKDDHSYFVIAYSYTNPTIDEANPEYSVPSALEGGLNGMVNAMEGAQVLTSGFTTFRGHQAMEYALLAEGERIDGMLFFNGTRLYNVMVNYSQGATPDPDLWTFSSGFQFVPIK